MGNNPQKNIRLKQIQGYEVKVSDDEQSEKHLITGNQFFYWEEYDRAKEFYLQSLRYNFKNIKSITNLGLVYKKQQKFYDAFICSLNKTYIEQGYEDLIEDKVVYKQSSNALISLATENYEEQEGSQFAIKQLDLPKKYFLSNKALMDILPLMKEDYEEIIQQLKKNNKKFELLFFLEQYKEKYGELNENSDNQLLELYIHFKLHQKAVNVYIQKLQQEPNDKRILELIIQSYTALNNEEKVNEYTTRLSSTNK